MKTEAQSNEELSQLRGLIEDMTVTMLTNVDEHGALTSRPMTPLEMDSSGALWFFIDRDHAGNGDQLHNVNLSFADQDESLYLSVSGRAEIVNDRSRAEQLWTSFATPWFPDGPDSPNLALLKVVPETAEYWDGPDSKTVRKLAMAASIAAKKPIGVGQHETLTGLRSKVKR